MKNKKQLSFNLSADIIKSLRDAVNGNIESMIQTKIKVNNKKQLNETSAWNCICSVMDRIDDIKTHLNKVAHIMAENANDTFAFCDFLNQSQTLIDCIYKLSAIFEISIDSVRKDASIFNQLGNNGKGTDDSYFKYIRSLCSVHPVGTDRHKEFQKYGNEWCPYLLPSSAVAVRLLFDDELEKGDFVATIYAENFEYNHHISLHLNKIFCYVEQRYKFISEITSLK